MDDVDRAQQSEIDRLKAESLANSQVDVAQQSAIDSLKSFADGNANIDRRQQDQLDRMMKNQRLMFLMLILNAVAACAQILECVKVWISL